VRLASGRKPAVLALAVRADGSSGPGGTREPGEPSELGATGATGAVLASPIEDLPEVRDELVAFLDAVEHSGAAGSVQVLPRPGRTPSTVLAVGIGQGTEVDWRAAGAGSAAAAARWPSVEMRSPEPAEVRASPRERAGVTGFARRRQARHRAQARRVTVDPGDDCARRRRPGS
jgi:leucyl aminopeptidase